MACKIKIISFSFTKLLKDFFFVYPTYTQVGKQKTENNSRILRAK